MSPAERAWSATARTEAVLWAVEERLIAGGAVTELRQFYGLSAQEVDVLLWQERNTSRFADSRACVPSDPQAPRDGVAA